jgi:hypothetical protein
VNLTTVRIVGACSGSSGSRCAINAFERGGIFDVAQSAGKLEVSNLILKGATKGGAFRMVYGSSGTCTNCDFESNSGASFVTHASVGVCTQCRFIANTGALTHSEWSSGKTECRSRKLQFEILVLLVVGK